MTERADFEAWLLPAYPSHIIGFERIKGQDGYASSAINDRWIGWQARAAIAHKREAELLARIAELEARLDATADSLDYLNGLTVQQVTALRQDAARYQWLRKIGVIVPGSYHRWTYHTDLDAAIDAAMRPNVGDEWTPTAHSGPKNGETQPAVGGPLDQLVRSHY